VLYVESHRDEYDRAPDAPSATLVQLIVLETLGIVDGGSVDEERVRRVIQEARGAPVPVGKLRPSP
jgi:hypothetical protein